MEDEVHSVAGGAAGVEVGDITFDDLDRRCGAREVTTLAGGEVVQDADALAGYRQSFGEMGADEAGATGNEIERRVIAVWSSGLHVAFVLGRSCLRSQVRRAAP